MLLCQKGSSQTMSLLMDHINKKMKGKDGEMAVNGGACKKSWRGWGFMSVGFSHKPYLCLQQPTL